VSKEEESNLCDQLNIKQKEEKEEKEKEEDSDEDWSIAGQKTEKKKVTPYNTAPKNRQTQ